MMSQEIAKILMQEWMHEYMEYLSDRPEKDLAWNLDLRATQIVSSAFFKWIEENK